jgi:two-component system LytT family response regulator
MSAVTALVVDDEPLARKRIERLLARDADFRVIGSFGSVAEAADLDTSIALDLVLLDVRMPERDGFELLKTWREQGIDPLVIFVTAYSDHAVAAFDVEAIDYILKPFDDERFNKSIARAKSVVLQARSASDKPATGPEPDTQTLPRLRDRLLIADGGHVSFVPIRDIEFMQAAGKLVKVFAQGNCHLLREPLHLLESRLDASQFVRVHRSTIVNVEHIVEMHPLFHGDYELVLKRGTRVTLSRRFRSRMSAFMTGALPGQA